MQTHAAELKKSERPSVFALPVLHVKSRPWIDQLDGDYGQDDHRQNHEAHKRGHTKIEQAAAAQRQVRPRRYSRRDDRFRLDHSPSLVAGEMGNLRKRVTCRARRPRNWATCTT